MGAEASSFTETETKNLIGVLYDEEARLAFEEHAVISQGDGMARVLACSVTAYASAHPRLLERGAVFFANLVQFAKARSGLQQVHDANFMGSVRAIEWRLNGEVGDEHRQRGLDGAPAATLETLYAVAELARPLFEEAIMTAIFRAGGRGGAESTFLIAPLKTKERAAQKVVIKCGATTSPATSWLFDVCRGAVTCATEQELVSLYNALEADPDLVIVRNKNRFDCKFYGSLPACLVLTVAVAVTVPETGLRVSHACELEIHHTAVEQIDSLVSDARYEYFQSYFLGSDKEAVAKRLEMLVRLPVSNFSNLTGLVQHMFSRHADDAAQLGHLGELLESMSELEFSTAVRARISQLRKTKEEGLDFAASLHRLAQSLQAQGKLCDAEPLCRRALAIYEQQLGPDHPHVAASLNNLAGVLQAQRKYEASEPLYRRDLAISEKQLGPDHPDIATTLNNLAGLLQVQGKYDSAEPLFRRALAIWAKQLGCDHPSVAAALNNLAVLLQAQGNYEDAEPLFRRALAVREKQLGPDHPDVAAALNNLAVLHQAQGNYDSAEPKFRRALAIREKQLGPHHVRVAATLSNLAILLHAQGKLQEAEPLSLRALAVWELQRAPDATQVARLKNTITDLHAVTPDEVSSRKRRRCQSDAGV